jgi:hypothetical protein
VHHEADEAIDSLYAWFPPQALTPAPLPEAAFSLTLKGRLDGQEALLTVRGQSAAEFKANLEGVRGLLDAPAQPPAAQDQGKGWCAKHQTQMKLNYGQDGRSWYSHKVDGRWCKGK